MRILLMVALFWLISSPSMAAGHCGPLDSYADHLAENFQEVPIANAQIFDGRMLTVFLAKSGSWSILATDSRGIACMITSGENWKTLPQTEPPIEGRDI